MTRSELIASMAKQLPHIKGEDVRLAVLCILELMSESLAKGQPVDVHFFGRFTTKKTIVRRKSQAGAQSDKQKKVRYKTEFVEDEWYRRALDGTEPKIDSNVIFWPNDSSDYFNGLPIYNPLYGKPELGDRVEFDPTINALGIVISSGIVSDVLTPPPALKKTIQKIATGDVLNEQESSSFQYIGQDICDWDLEYIAVCIVAFDESVSPAVARRLTGASVREVQTTEIEAEGIKAMLSENGNGQYRLQGAIKCLLDGFSVIERKENSDYSKTWQAQDKVAGVARSDKVMPQELLSELNAAVDDLCSGEAPDYHPGSGGVVRDIVHPSLYCYVHGVSKLIGDPDRDAGQSVYPIWTRQTEQEYPFYGSGEDFWGRDYEESLYQWLPAEFCISAAGEVSIDSYINNLDREKYPGMYDLIERLFAQVLPLFEIVCYSLRNDFYGGSRGFSDFPAWPGIPKNCQLRDRSLQVITKIIEYHVDDYEDSEGVWHVEGMAHENILATALCVIKRDANFDGARIEFRRHVYQDEGDDLIEVAGQGSLDPLENMDGADVLPLGRLDTPEGRVIVFPNSHIHRVSAMRSLDKKDSVRRIIVFWLVNPERRILSTADVPLQQGIMAHEVALRARLGLMNERKFHKQSFNVRAVSLCEH